MGNPNTESKKRQRFRIRVREVQHTRRFRNNPLQDLTMLDMGEVKYFSGAYEQLYFDTKMKT